MVSACFTLPEESPIRRNSCPSLAMYVPIQVAVISVHAIQLPGSGCPLSGREAMERIYFTGDVAITRQFSVQAFTDYAGGRIVSEFSVPVAATSVVDGGASDSTPTDPPSNPVPDTPESPESTDQTQTK